MSLGRISKLYKVAADNKVNVLYTLLILITHFGYGINVNIIGSTLVDLRFIYGVTLDTVSYIVVAQQVGQLTGAMAGWLYKWINRQLMLTVLVAIWAVTIILAPHYGQFAILLVCIVLNGVGGGAWDSSCDMWIVEMWPESNAGMLQVMQFMFGVGAIVAPLLSAPFVKGEAIVDAANSTITPADRTQALTLPFAITGIVPILVPTVWLILFFTCRYQRTMFSSNSQAKEEETGVLSRKDEISQIRHRTFKLVICGLCMGAYAASELGWFAFATAMYQYMDIQLDASTAAFVMSILSASFTIGRFTTALITIKVIPDIIIGYNYVIMIGSLLIILIGRDSLTAIFIGTTGLGYGYSAMWPAFMAFVERHLRLTDRNCSIFALVAGVAALVTPLTLGQTFREQPMMLFVLEGSFVALSVTTYAIICAWIYTEKWRQRPQQSQTMIKSPQTDLVY